MQFNKYKHTHTHTHTRGLCSTEQDSTGNTTMVHFFSCGRESPTSPLRRAPEKLSPGRRRSPLPRQPPPLQTPLPLTPERDRRSAAGSSGNKCSPGSRALLASPTFVLPLRLDSTSLQPSLSPRVLARARYFFFVVHVSRGTTNSASSRLLPPPLVVPATSRAFFNPFGWPPSALEERPSGAESTPDSLAKHLPLVKRKNAFFRRKRTSHRRSASSALQPPPQGERLPCSPDDLAPPSSCRYRLIAINISINIAQSGVVRGFELSARPDLQAPTVNTLGRQTGRSEFRLRERYGVAESWVGRNQALMLQIVRNKEFWLAIFL